MGYNIVLMHSVKVDLKLLKGLIDSPTAPLDQDWIITQIILREV